MPEINDFSHVFEVGMRPRIWDDSETNQSSFWSQKSEPQIVNEIATIFTCQKQFRSHLTAGSLPTFTNVGKFSGSQTLGCIDILLPNFDFRFVFDHLDRAELIPCVTVTPSRWPPF